MEQVFVANPKGGCGKTTIATQLAGYWANRERKVLLVDHDAQRSSSDWLSSRPNECSQLKSVVSDCYEPVATDCDIAVHDMPAACDLESVSGILGPSDKVIIPVLASPNDIKACLRFLMAMTRSGVLERGAKAGLVSNRVRHNTSYANVLNEFLERIELPLVGALRDTQNYVKAMDRGLSIFDLPESRVRRDLDQWQSIFSWLSN